MTIIRKSLIVAFGLLVAGSMAPASAGALTSAKPAIAFSEIDGLQLVGDRGSWVEPKTRWKSSRKFKRGRDYGRYDGHHHHKRHFKRKGRKFFKRGFRRGYGRGYDEGYYEGRRHSHYDRRHRHHRRYKPSYGFQGGFFFGDGFSSRGNFRFRY